MFSITIRRLQINYKSLIFNSLKNINFNYLNNKDVNRKLTSLGIVKLIISYHTSSKL